MNINNNQWTTIVLITAALMLVFLIFVFYDNKKATELPSGTLNENVNVPKELPDLPGRSTPPPPAPM
ncbi:MAG: hypothetical protein H0W50_05230 [Parachlamydiaceae bacterium]|nr:hypothetical protein [Parachlamydiaceae bacterium]